MNLLVHLVFAPFAPPLRVFAHVLEDSFRIEIQRRVEKEMLIVRSDDQLAELFLKDHWPPGRYGDFETWPTDIVPIQAQVASVHSDSRELVTQIILALAQQFDFVVDLRRGEIFSRDAFVKRCLSEPEWAWDRGPDDIFYFSWPPNP